MDNQNSKAVPSDAAASYTAPKERTQIDLAQEALARFDALIGDVAGALVSTPKPSAAYELAFEGDAIGKRPCLTVTATFDVSPDDGFILNPTF